jgi:hypothetical protein
MMSFRKMLTDSNIDLNNIDEDKLLKMKRIFTEIYRPMETIKYDF